MCPDRESNPQTFALWDDTQPSEPPQSGRYLIFFNLSNVVQYICPVSVVNNRKRFSFHRNSNSLEDRRNTGAVGECESSCAESHVRFHCTGTGPSSLSFCSAGCRRSPAHSSAFSWARHRLRQMPAPHAPHCHTHTHTHTHTCIPVHTHT